ncbi:MAG: hypothetical protein NZ879_03140 [Archaeoglobaceae archaeon]|nr:hypothetical protein [Archaeoglobaceae archaeon]MDW8117962.1 hypothetical protein [Archaeoglobaceae archaeon]
MYLELWIDNSRKEEIIRKLKEVCKEVWEVYYNYDLIVKVDSEEKVKIDGVLKYRRHYNC